MQKLKVVIELEIKGDLGDEDTIREDVYQYLQELMEEGELSYEVSPTEEDEEDEYEIF